MFPAVVRDTDKALNMLNCQVRLTTDKYWGSCVAGSKSLRGSCDTCVLNRHVHHMTFHCVQQKEIFKEYIQNIIPLKLSFHPSQLSQATVDVQVKMRPNNPSCIPIKSKVTVCNKLVLKYVPFLLAF